MQVFHEFSDAQNTAILASMEFTSELQIGRGLNSLEEMTTDERSDEATPKRAIVVVRHGEETKPVWYTLTFLFTQNEFGPKLETATYKGSNGLQQWNVQFWIENVMGKFRFVPIDRTQRKEFVALKRKKRRAVMWKYINKHMRPIMKLEGGDVKEEAI